MAPLPSRGHNASSTPAYGRLALRPGRYREEDEAKEWREKDPLERVRLLLEKAEVWTPEWQKELDEEASHKIEVAVEVAESLPEPTLDQMFGRMYEEPTPPLRDQLDEASS